MTSNSYHIIHVDFILFRFHNIILFVLLPCVMSIASFNSYLLHVWHVISYSKQTYTYTMANRNISSHIKYIQGQIRLIPIHIRLISLSCLKPLIKPLSQLHFMIWDARLILLVIVLLNFHFQKCRDPNPQLDPVGESKLEPGLLRHFQSKHFVWFYKKKNFKSVAT